MGKDVSKEECKDVMETKGRLISKIVEETILEGKCISDVMEDIGNETVNELKYKFGTDNVIFQRLLYGILSIFI